MGGWKGKDVRISLGLRDPCIYAARLGTRPTLTIHLRRAKTIIISEEPKIIIHLLTKEQTQMNLSSQTATHHQSPWKTSKKIKAFSGGRPPRLLSLPLGQGRLRYASYGRRDSCNTTCDQTRQLAASQPPLLSSPLHLGDIRDRAPFLSGIVRPDTLRGTLSTKSGMER